MKLRVEKDSIRLRLRPSDVAQFTSQGHVETSVDFGAGAQLVYALVLAPDLAETRATISGCRVEVMVPARQGNDWAEGDQVGISAQQGPLSILIEKDFQCMHKDDVANADAYPNPLVAA